MSVCVLSVSMLQRYVTFILISKNLRELLSPYILACLYVGKKMDFISSCNYFLLLRSQLSRSTFICQLLLLIIFAFVSFPTELHKITIWAAIQPTSECSTTVTGKQKPCLLQPGEMTLLWINLQLWLSFLNHQTFSACTYYNIINVSLFRPYPAVNWHPSASNNSHITFEIHFASYMLSNMFVSWLLDYVLALLYPHKPVREKSKVPLYCHFWTFSWDILRLLQ